MNNLGKVITIQYTEVLDNLFPFHYRKIKIYFLGFVSSTQQQYLFLLQDQYFGVSHTQQKHSISAVKPKSCIFMSNKEHKLTRVQKMHWHCAIVVICSTGYSPRQSLQDTNGSSTKSQVGLYLAVVIAEQSEEQHKK